MPLKEIAERQNLLHAKSTPQTILKHVLDDVRMGDTALVSSFGAESVVLLHMVAEIDPATQVIFIETEMLFNETLVYQKEVAAHLGLTNVQVITPSRAALLERDSEGLLHQADVDACCTLRKKEPLERALKPYGSWITGRKRYQSGTRAALPVFEKEAGSTRIKVNPLASWGRTEIAAYMDDHDLPRHPLVAKGYPSIGCQPCTHAVGVDDDPRAGRWEGTEKTECGIHF
ncbi:MAG: phosphoadenylyl-sulfate reductase [Yoonia sp.]|uniref:phosphoadenylyl-sulfate reductase n=1 Tax=Yoonia sp. TaxID=2212373 RepID=UPI003265BC0D